MVGGAPVSTPFPLAAYAEVQACLVSQLEAACSSLMVLSCLPPTPCPEQCCVSPLHGDQN